MISPLLYINCIIFFILNIKIIICLKIYFVLIKRGGIENNFGVFNKEDTESNYLR